MSLPEAALGAFVLSAGLAQAGEEGEWVPLAGGVSSDIWRVSLRSGELCVKRALAQLRVVAEWSAPVDRNAYEWDYLQLADRIVPGHVPRPIAHDPERGLFAMAWLSPQRYRLWKAELLAGRADPSDAAAVGTLIGRIHAATAGNPDVAARFATDANFHALRIEPYLLATADKHPALKERLGEIARTTAGTRLALVHGDVSPKNILCGPNGPVLLDAECAWFGDPAFDLAFCLNHLLIKARVVREARDALVRSFDRMTEAYCAEIAWEPADRLERRAARLLKSPVEYLAPPQQEALRRAAIAAIEAGHESFDRVRSALLA
jgi:5-methylthioribose kinase